MEVTGDGEHKLSMGMMSEGILDLRYFNLHSRCSIFANLQLNVEHSM